MKEVISLAVETITETIPNIYKQALCNGNIITLDDDVSNELDVRGHSDQSSSQVNLIRY